MEIFNRDGRQWVRYTCKEVCKPAGVKDHGGSQTDLLYWLEDQTKDGHISIIYSPSGKTKRSIEADEEGEKIIASYATRNRKLKTEGNRIPRSKARAMLRSEGVDWSDSRFSRAFNGNGAIPKQPVTLEECNKVKAEYFRIHNGTNRAKPRQTFATPAPNQDLAKLSAKIDLLCAIFCAAWEVTPDKLKAAMEMVRSTSGIDLASAEIKKRNG